ncbi:hypothetical protein PGT21_010417 [Puccinia graminis f. sp. tritici]|uniref:Secreted protein n=1 Tax=Puccinia graminis f. sp. tritici TaxID=56615 RepID=A0A5B0N5Y9_PUCGR|nr:hypothetical protein PGT21_010417 [Puccinia graminis f. sp. tritici]
MNSAIIAVFLALASQAILATYHTTCYDYFLKKDGCVFSSPATSQRCPAPTKDHTDPVHRFNYGPPKAKPNDGHSLQRRYDDNNPSFSVAGGKGACDNYNSATDLGVCLWSGAEQKAPTAESAGWLNGVAKSNCGKTVYVQRKGDPSTVKYVKVLDENVIGYLLLGCSFNTTLTNPGCFEIALTTKVIHIFLRPVATA